jgi:hypothetical protein
MTRSLLLIIFTYPRGIVLCYQINESSAERRMRAEAHRPAMYVTAPQPAAANARANPGDYTVMGTSSGVRRPSVAYNFYNYGLPTMQGRDEPDCDSAPNKNESVDTSDSAAAVDAEVVANDALANVENEKTASSGNDRYQMDSAPAEDDVLHCPSCRRRFTIDEHVDLMDHMEVCGH